MRPAFKQRVQGYRERRSLGPAVRTSSLVDTTELVDHSAADTERGIGLERDAAPVIEAVDRRDQADHRRGRDVVTVGERSRRNAHATGNADGQVRVALDKSTTRH